jgi:solute carrier family 25 phosphate transporter 23/24/25/41
MFEKQGNLINVLKITPESAIKFTSYEQIKILMGQDGAQLKPFEKFLAGTSAGFIAQSTIYPMEVLKTRLALRKTGEFNGISDCVRKIYHKEGIKAFYRGYL